MTFLPDEAADNFKDLEKPQAAVAYVTYCRFRNHLTGRCRAHPKTIAVRSGINVAYLSTMKTVLLDKGWIVRDPEDLRYGVIPIKGAREFEERRRWELSQMKVEDIWKFQNGDELIWNYQKGHLENPNFGAAGSLFNVPSSDPSTAAARLEIPNENSVREGRAAGRQQAIDDAFVARLITEQAYPPTMTQAEVRQVFLDLKFDCAVREPPQLPTWGEFRAWLTNYRRPAQEALPHTGSAPVVKAQFDPGGRRYVEIAYPLTPAPDCQICGGDMLFRQSGGTYCTCRICQLCFGSGERHGRLCPHMTGEISEQRARTG